MLAEARRSVITDTVKREQVVRVADLAETLGVSLMTVRRDIDALHDAGELEKIHGGAKTRSQSSMYEPGFELKSTQAAPEKEAIARSAASLVEEGMAVGLSAGTTTWTLAKYLVPAKRLTIFTNSVRVANVFHEAHSSNTVLLTGGERTPSDALVGPMATQSLQHLHLDMLFMGVHGMDAHAGFTTPNMPEAEMDRALIATSHRVVVLADHSKWGTLGVSSIASFDQIDEMISDEGLPAEAVSFLTGQVRRLWLVSVPQ
ncbi:transcriptional regulator, DeoR family [Renibacterium salmoninarum ATCC 33209]|uniref:Transcriptional regulator, DeoR family n=1 Tax=Renibacterium salmoninarum (strain ATCC 33209 / DSM 20767 / JCM 11484 / NBRC 15589 / NCIMB 2235) TaxID=288705 RepID=A9WTJ2_RENSM|nr:DeoR/GlpR family DNA-binding transcription regulator [Renibacterium salmoninarum]ABY24513.1 transcriptional regulator, DeoR family [Renibacterium salmoninarum ATCC 33209]